MNERVESLKDAASIKSYQDCSQLCSTPHTHHAHQRQDRHRRRYHHIWYRMESKNNPSSFLGSILVDIALPYPHIIMHASSQHTHTHTHMHLCACTEGRNPKKENRRRRLNCYACSFCGSVSGYSSDKNGRIEALLGRGRGTRLRTDAFN